MHCQFAAPRVVRPHFIQRIIIVGIGVLSSISVGATDLPLSLEQAQALAVARSRQLAAQDFAITASRDMAIAAGQLSDPVIKMGIDNLPVNGADRGSLSRDFMTMRRIGVTQELTRIDKRQLRVERFEKAAEKSLAEKMIIVATIERDTAIAWLDQYYTERMALLIAEQTSQAKLEAEAAELQYRAGRGSHSDVIAASSALVMMEDRVSEFQRKVRNARTMLARWTGNPSDIVLGEGANFNTIRLKSDTLETSLAHHPQIATLNTQIAIAESEVKLAEANKKSDWTVEVALQQRGTAYSNMISIGVSIPFQWDQKNRQDRELSAKLAMREQAKAERDELLRTHLAEIRTMLDEWQSNRERIIRYEKQLLPLTKERSLALMAAYRGGKSSLIDLLAARRYELDMRLLFLQLQADTARLWAQLNFFVPVAEQDIAATSSTKKDLP